MRFDVRETRRRDFELREQRSQLAAQARRVHRQTDDGEDRVFQLRFNRVEPQKVADRIAQEARFDPDLWVLALEMRSGDLGILVVSA